MNNKKIIIFISIIAIGIIYLISNLIVNERVKVLVDQKYSNIASSIKKNAKNAVEEKMNATLALAVAISQDSMMKQALIKNDHTLIDLKNIADNLKQHTEFKNPWLHLISKNGDSILKSWVDKKGENILNIRLDIVKIINEPKVTTTISVGKFNMTFKAIVPIYDNKEFIGIFEVVTNFDSVAKNLEGHGTNSIILTDKKYKKQLTMPYTKTFIDDYYVANSNANKNLIKFVEEMGVKHFIDNHKPYHIHKDLVTSYEFLDVHGSTMGYFILFQPLESIDMTDISKERTSLFFTLLSILIIFVSAVYYFINKIHTNKVEILNSKLESANKKMDLLNKNLEQRIKEEVEENQQKDRLVYQQSKMAAMGEMIGNIAHQWRQPISIISIWANNIMVDIDIGNVNNKDLREYANNINVQTQHLSQTIDDFRNFFIPTKDTNTFELKHSIDKTMSLLSASFKTHNIEVIENIEDIEITALENELTQALLNIIKNAEDILINLPQEDKKLIFIDIYKKDNSAIIEIKDNGGGAEEKILDKVFEPYFTTKYEAQGTGIGLYMTESIITKHLNGKIFVSNLEYMYENKHYRGARFSIELPIGEVKVN